MTSVKLAFENGTLEMHCAYDLHLDGAFSDNRIRELLLKGL